MVPPTAAQYGSSRNINTLGVAGGGGARAQVGMATRARARTLSPFITYLAMERVGLKGGGPPEALSVASFTLCRMAPPWPYMALAVPACAAAGVERHLTLAPQHNIIYLCHV